jgi:hypothetical protein
VGRELIASVLLHPVNRRQRRARGRGLLVPRRFVLSVGVPSAVETATAAVPARLDSPSCWESSPSLTRRACLN